MNHNKVFGLLSICLVLQSCAFGKAVSYFPDMDSLSCDEVTFFSPQSSLVSSTSVPYYIVPFGYIRQDRTSDNLKIRLYFKIESSLEDFQEDSIYIKNLATVESLYPLSIILASNGSYENSHFLTYEAEFAVLAGAWDAFELQFTREVYGCSIPTILFTKTEFGFNEAML